MFGAPIVDLLDMHGFGSYWYCPPLREDLRMVTEGAFLVFCSSWFHLSATLRLKKFRRSSVFEVTLTDNVVSPFSGSCSVGPGLWYLKIPLATWSTPFRIV